MKNYMKGIIIYKAKYGATKKYADWLVEETGLRKDIRKLN
jgi:menaquinone-dependent protoporphyrinogen IX oxidase